MSCSRRLTYALAANGGGPSQLQSARLVAATTNDDKMITSIHTLIYSDDPNSTRAFLRDVLGWKYVAEDFDNDWLIFKSGPSEMAVHPTHSEWEGQTYDYPRHHSIALMCDDIDTTVSELRRKERSSEVLSSNANTGASS